MHVHMCSTVSILCGMLTTTYFDVLEFKHVSLYKSASDLLIGPGYEELVVVVCLLVK